LVTCVGSDSLLKVVQSMVDAKVHRVWIVSSQEERKVQGVISQSDILAALVGVDQCVKKPL
jgi:CBS-domain-containing membrane protein